LQKLTAQYIKLLVPLKKSVDILLSYTFPTELQKNTKVEEILSRSKVSLKIVSTVLNNSKEFGWRNMFDSSNETCWNSAQGSPQFIVVKFVCVVDIQEVEITFQGGFVGKICEFWVEKEKKNDDNNSWKLIHTCEPKNNNTLQKFTLVEKEKTVSTQALRLVFPDSTDLHGRIVIYRLDIVGSTSPSGSSSGFL